MNGEIAFEQVWFAYNDPEWVLKGINFHVQPGQTLALVGHTGSGKTTIANLVSQLYKHQQGSIKLDGHSIDEWDLPSIRRQIALVLQDVFLFSGSIEENIRLHDDELPTDAIKTAAMRIGAYDFINKRCCLFFSTLRNSKNFKPTSI